MLSRSLAATLYVLDIVVTSEALNTSWLPAQIVVVAGVTATNGLGLTVTCVGSDVAVHPKLLGTVTL